MVSTTDAGTTVDLFLGGGGVAVWNEQQRIVDVLDRLEAAGAIDDYRVRSWGRGVSVSGPLADTGAHSRAVERIREFEEWADSRDVPVDLPFRRRDVVSEYTGERHRVVRPPVICLAVYEDGELAGVYPCIEDGSDCSVEDVLQSGVLNPDAERDATELFPGIGPDG